ncbi:MAG: preprotein translocase subunit Tim44 [Rhizobacter sp.]|nr:preprotein translocase subunit Tim44 [Rhizobacter sp.]
MKKILVGALVVMMSVAFLPGVADAKRFGGGGSSGMKRSVPTQSAPMSNPGGAAPAKPAAPANAAAPAAAGTAAAAAAPKRSWMGPIAGIAAGLGLAALMSHLGMGAAFGNFLTMLLLAVVAFVVIRFLMRKFAGGNAGNKFQMAGAGAGSNMNTDLRADANASTFNRSGPLADSAATPSTGFGSPSFGSNVPAVVPAAGSSIALPADFDAAGFERIAKMIFIRMQAANDTGDVADLRQFTTPEMFASARVDLQERAALKQTTDVVQLNAQVLDVAQEDDRQIVSVRYHGLIREEENGVAAPFDEVWHLVKPEDGSREWAIAGVQQLA